MRVRFKEVKTKYVANLQELKDIQNEHEDEKEQLLDTIREQEKDVKKFSAILNILMNQEQIEHIVNNSEWNEETKEWKVPSFVYKEKNSGLPKLSSHSISTPSKELIDVEKEKEKREVIFKNNGRHEEKGSSAGFKVNKVLQNARDGSGITSTPSAKTFSNSKNLTPLEVFDRPKNDFSYEQSQKRRRM